MNPGELQRVEAKRKSLLGRQTTAETVLRHGLRTHGFGETARAHRERSRTHIFEANIALKEGRPVRAFSQLMDDVRRRYSQHI
jgi:hypothetical protein